MKKLLLPVLLLSMGSIIAMQKPEIMLEDRLLVAVRDNNLAGVKAAVEAGAPVNEIKYLIGYQGEEPLVNAVQGGKYAIAEYLLSKGADKSILDRFLIGDATSADVDSIQWLLKNGAKDVNDKVLATTREYEADEPNAALKTRYSQVIRLLEQSKTGPIRLTPVTKPKPATRPTNTTPVKLAPRVKPAPAQPK